MFKKLSVAVPAVGLLSVAAPSFAVVDPAVMTAITTGDWLFLHRFAARLFGWLLALFHGVTFSKMRVLLIFFFFSISSAFAAVDSVLPSSTTFRYGGFLSLSDLATSLAAPSQGVFYTCTASSYTNGSPITCISPATTFKYNAFVVTGSAVCPTSTPPYSFNTANSMCERNIDVCAPKKGQVALSGLVDWGVDPNSGPPAGFNSQCISGCAAVLDSGTSIQYSRVISGITHYYGLLQQSFDGTSCTSGTGGGTLPTATSLPPESCASGQVAVKMPTGIKCYADKGVGTGTSASGVPASGTGTGSTASGVPATGTGTGTAASGVSGTGTTSPTSPSPTACDPATDPNKCLAPNPCLTSPDLISCMKAEPVVNASDIGTKDIPIDSSFASVTFASGGSCPAPKTLTLSKIIFSISYQPLCDFLAIFKLVILACSAFVGGLILTGQRAADSAG